MNFKKVALALTLSASFGLMMACNDESSSTAPSNDENPTVESSSSQDAAGDVSSSESQGGEEVQSSESNSEDPTSSEASAESSSGAVNLNDILDSLKNHEGDIAAHISECSIDSSAANAVVMNMTVDGVKTETKVTVADDGSMTTVTTTEGASEEQLAQVCDKAKTKAAAQQGTVTCEGNVVTTESPASEFMTLDMVKMGFVMSCSGVNGEGLGGLGGLLGGLLGGDNGLDNNPGQQ